MIEWNGDFSTGDTSQYLGASKMGGVQQFAPDRTVIVTKSRTAGKALQMTVKPGDLVDVHNNWERCELLLPQEESNGYPNSDDWWSWSVLYPSSTQHTGGGNQFHPTGNGGPGQSGIKCHWPALDAEFFGEPHSPYFDASSPSRSYEKTLLNPLATDTWYDIVLHVKWSLDYSTGLVETFVNGARTSPLVHCATLFAVDRGVYFKFGVYRAPQSYPETIIFDGARRGSTYADVVAPFPAGVWPATPDAPVTPPPPPPPPVPSPDLAGAVAELKLTTLSGKEMVKRYGADVTKWPAGHWRSAFTDLGVIS